MSLKGFFIFVFITIISSIVFLYTRSILILIFNIALIAFVWKKYDIKFSLILIICFSFFQFYRINKIPSIDEAKTITSNAIVYEAKEKYIIAKIDKERYLIYINENEQFEKNDEIYVEGECVEIKNDLDIDVFDFKDYLNHKRVFYEIKTKKIQKTKENKSLSKKIINFLTCKLKDESLDMTKMLIFNDKKANVDNYENLKDINAIHLFVVSGFHISFIFSIINKLFKKNKILSIALSTSICLLYVFILGFTISSTRALLTIVLSLMFDKYLNKLDCISISGIVFLLIEPLNIYNYSFIMTYIMTYVIVFTNNALSKQTKINRLILISLISFLSMLPFQLLFNYKINFISLLTNFFLSYVVILIFILCIVGMIFSLFNGNVFGFVYKAFNTAIEYLANLNTSIVFGSIKTWLVILFYVLILILIYSLESNKIKNVMISFSFIGLFFICLYNRNFFVFYQQVTFLNVYQGDCIIIQDSYNGKVMLIDTGGLRNYDVASKKIIPYLNYHGIRSIDVVVITHDDFDHNGALDSLCEQFDVKKVIDDPFTEDIYLGKIHLKNLNKYANYYENDNDKSMVLYGEICSYNFLFTGDASINIEKRIIEDNEILDVDVLKVAHHGSNTSTSKDFVNYIQPKYAIISVGENNKYGHPTKKVLEILNENGIIIYRTDSDGTIRFKGEILNDCIIETAR